MTGASIVRQAPRPFGLCMRWVLVLLLQGLSNDVMRAALAGDDLPCPSDELLDAYRREYLPAKFKPRSTKGKALLARLGIEEFFTVAPEAEQAQALLRQPKARELLESALLVVVPFEAIVRTLSICLHTVVSRPTIKLYKRVFFDVDSVSRAALRVEVHTRVRIAVQAVVTDPADEPAARRAMRGDARSIAMTMPASPLAWAGVLLAMGFPPTRFELPRVVGQLESIAALRLSEALLRGGAADERRAGGYAAVLEKVSAIRQAVVPPDAALEKKLRVLRLRTSSEKTPTVSDLRAAGCDVTVDLGPPAGTAADEHDARDGDLEDAGAPAA
jgi:hypothetical protein